MAAAVGLIDIITNVFEQCDPPTLARCARVCLLWHEAAIKRLWRGSYNHEFQWELPTLSEMQQSGISRPRLQYYLRHTRYYTLHIGSKPPQLLEWDFRELLSSGALTAPRAEFLSVDLMTALMDESTMVPLLVPSLRAAQFYGGLYTDAFLIAVKTKCPRLRGFLLDNNSDEMQSRAFIDFLNAMPQLTSIELEQSGMTMTRAMVFALLSRPNLTRLCLGETGLLGCRLAWALSDIDGPTSITSLRHLELWIGGGEDLRRLLPELRNLQTVRLGVREPLGSPDTDVLEPLSYCTRLREVSLKITDTAPIRLESLVTLARSCGTLRELCIEVDNAPGLSPLVMGAHRWRELTQNLKMIESLDIECPVPIDIYDLAWTGHDCPQLVELRLNAEVDAFGLAQIHPRPFFPSLETLEVTAFTSLDNFKSPAAMENAAYRLVEVLQRHMPCLTEIYGFSSLSGRGRNFETALYKALSEAQEPVRRPGGKSRSIRQIINDELIRNT